jgi:hypothetical protein
MADNSLDGKGPPQTLTKEEVERVVVKKHNKLISLYSKVDSFGEIPTELQYDYDLEGGLTDLITSEFKTELIKCIEDYENIKKGLASDLHDTNTEYPLIYYIGRNRKLITQSEKLLEIQTLFLSGMELDFIIHDDEELVDLETDIVNNKNILSKLKAVDEANTYLLKLESRNNKDLLKIAGFTPNKLKSEEIKN